jgi:hypothetical protein
VYSEYSRLPLLEWAHGLMVSGDSHLAVSSVGLVKANVESSGLCPMNRLDQGWLISQWIAYKYIWDIWRQYQRAVMASLWSLFGYRTCCEAAREQAPCLFCSAGCMARPYK